MATKTQNDKYFALSCKSHYSLLHALTTPKHLKTLGLPEGVGGIAITDYNNISGSLAFRSKDENCIIGATIKMYDGAEFVLLAKNLEGWKTLILVTLAAQQHKTEEEILKIVAKSPNDLILLTGTRLYEWLTQEDWQDRCQKWIDNFPLADDSKFVSICFSGWHPPGFQKKLRELKQKKVAAPDSLYFYNWQHEDLQILNCIDKKIKLDEAKEGGGKVFDFDNYHLPTYEEALSMGWRKEELQQTNVVASLCQSYELKNDPLLPKMAENSQEEVRQQCRDGWRRKIVDKIAKDKHDEYGERVKHEMEIIHQEEFEDYFLLVQDIQRFAKNELKLFVGSSRGSAGGSIVSYLMDITEVDPIEHGLLFSRFISSARKGSLPDIDCDYPVKSREQIIEYIRNRFSREKTGHIATYQTLKARAAITAVMTAHGENFQAIKRITDLLPAEHKVVDKMNDEEEDSLIRYALRHKPKDFQGICSIDEDGRLTGEYSGLFEQAIRLENTKRALSKHAAGIIISSLPIQEVAPMLVDKNNDVIVGLEMNECEQLGLIKMDVLGVAALDKVATAVKRIAEVGVLLNGS